VEVAVALGRTAGGAAAGVAGAVASCARRAARCAVGGARAGGADRAVRTLAGSGRDGAAHGIGESDQVVADVLAAGDPQQLPAARRGHAGGMLVAEVVGMGLAETGERAEHRGRVLVHEGQGADCRLRAGGPGAFTSWHAQQCTQVAGPAGAARPWEARVGSGTAGAGLQCTAWTSNPAVPPP